MILLLGLFSLVLAVAISTYSATSKRWWGTQGYRVRIIRRNCWVALGAASLLSLALHLNRHPKGPLNTNQSTAASASAVARFETAGPNAVATPVWPAPNTPIPGLNTTIGFEEARQAEDDTPDRLHCGAERWLVKTLSDAEFGKVNFQPVPATITQLISIPQPADLPSDHRIAPVELTTYVVRARLLDYKREQDDDFHLVIAEPSDRSKTMIAEIPAPGCSQAQALLAPPRREFVDLFGRVSLSWSWSEPSPTSDLIEISGVGFFDFEHGQNGVAPNAIELHPVIAIRRLPETAN
jgi:hypothetical protein